MPSEPTAEISNEKSLRDEYQRLSGKPKGQKVLHLERFLAYHTDPKKRWIDWETFPSIVFCAPRRSGKNVLLNELLFTNRHLLDEFTIFVFTGTPHTYQFGWIDQKYVMSLDNLNERLEALMEQQLDYMSRGEKRRVLLILDDPITESRKNLRYMSNYVRVLTQGRHFHISTIAIEQDITFLDRKERQQIEFAFYFANRSKNTVEIITEEEAGDIDPKVFKSTFHFYTKDHKYVVFNHAQKSLAAEEAMRYGKADFRHTEDYTWVVGKNSNPNRRPPPTYVDHMPSDKFEDMRAKNEEIEAKLKKRVAEYEEKQRSKLAKREQS